MIYQLDESKGVKFYGDENFIKQIFDKIKSSAFEYSKMLKGNSIYYKKTGFMTLLYPTDWIGTLNIKYDIYIFDSRNNTFEIPNAIYKSRLKQMMSSVDDLASFNNNNVNIFNNRLNNVNINLTIFYNKYTHKIIFSNDYNSIAAFIHELMHAYEYRMRQLKNLKYSVNNNDIELIQKLKSSKNENTFNNLGVILFNLLPHEQNAFVNEYFIDYVYNNDYHNYVDDYINYINNLSKDEVLFFKNNCFDAIKVICKKLTKNNFEHNFKYELKRKLLKLKYKCERTIDEYSKLNNEYLKSIKDGNIEYLNESERCKKILKGHWY